MQDRKLNDPTTIIKNKPLAQSKTLNTCKG
uniref:Uncharacterized protein n=1 Tax=Rhizophora mucronata TaxID=61149 RepID=A0A2P2QNK0_RHIMU